MTANTAMAVAFPGCHEVPAQCHQLRLVIIAYYHWCQVAALYCLSFRLYRGWQRDSRVNSEVVL